MSDGKIADSDTVQITINAKSPKPPPQALQLAINTGSDFVLPGEALNVRITVANASSTDRSNVVLKMRYPGNELDFVYESFISDGGDCASSNYCNESGELLTWNLGTLTSGTSKTVSLPPSVKKDLTAGTTIVFSAEVQASSAEAILVNRTIEVIAQPVLTLAVDEDHFPVQPDETLTYTLTYSNQSLASIATGTLLSLPLPEAVTFIEASHGGILSDNDVQWSLGTLNPTQSGQVTLVVRVNSDAIAGSLLMTQARLSNDGDQYLTTNDSIVPIESERALALRFNITPNPVQAGEPLNVQLTVSNTSPFDRSDVELTMRYPGNELDFVYETAISDAGNCTTSNFCNDPGELLSWTINTLTSGGSKTVSLPVTLKSDVLSGMNILYFAVAEHANSRTHAKSSIAVGN